MRIIVVGDSHGDNKTLDFIARKEIKANIFLHAGDSQSMPEEIRPFLAIKGNCDFFIPGLEGFQIIDTDFGKIYIQHFPISLSDMKRLHENKGIKIFIHGHTHVKEYKEYEGFYVFSPGSTSRPRDDGASYLVIETTKDSIKHEFIYL